MPFVPSKAKHKTDKRADKEAIPTFREEDFLPSSTELLEKLTNLMKTIKIERERLSLDESPPLRFDDSNKHHPMSMRGEWEIVEEGKPSGKKNVLDRDVVDSIVLDGLLDNKLEPEQESESEPVDIYDQIV